MGKTPGVTKETAPLKLYTAPMSVIVLAKADMVIDRKRTRAIYVVLVVLVGRRIYD